MMSIIKDVPLSSSSFADSLPAVQEHGKRALGPGRGTQIRVEPSPGPGALLCLRRCPMLVPNERGNYQFLPGGEPYSNGTVAASGFEILHVTLRRPVPYREGFRLIEARLGEAGRPKAALCGIELRSPAPFTRAGFLEFNRD